MKGPGLHVGGRLSRLRTAGERLPGRVVGMTTRGGNRDVWVWARAQHYPTPECALPDTSALSKLHDIINNYNC